MQLAQQEKDMEEDRPHFLDIVAINTLERQVFINSQGANLFLLLDFRPFSSSPFDWLALLLDFLSMLTKAVYGGRMSEYVARQ